MDQKLAHLQFIQAAITRMASNSFLIKGWSITLVAALFALAAAGSQPRFVQLAFFPAFAFWLLDGYFLRQERLFRRVYDHVRKLDAADIDFAMDTTPFAAKVESWLATCFSATLATFHGAIAASILVVMRVVG